MLFFWEEEVQRLRKLEGEERELTGLIDAAEKAQTEGETGTQTQTQMLEQMKFARERVRMKKRQKPTERRTDLEADRDTVVGDAFRARGEALGYVSAMEGRDGQVTAQELPPSYHPSGQSGRSWSVA